MDSGIVINNQAVPAIIFSQTVTQPGAAWIRLMFSDVQLAGSGDTASYVRLTSIQDGAGQIMRADAFAQWQNHSAFFNGDSVLVELFAFPGAGANSVAIGEIVAGFAEEAPEEDGEPRSPCGTTDERVLSDDPRSARVVDADGVARGTVFLINDAAHSFLTSGQSAGFLEPGAVVEFDPPLTFPNGITINHPSPDDQYVYDPASVQRATGGTGSGNNWGFFGCFPNSTTGLRPYEAQQAAFELADVIPAASGQNIEYFGFGAVVPPLFRTWSFIQKTAQGEYLSFAGTRITFRIDATAGDSGAPLIDIASGDVIGVIHEDGCTAGGGGANGATAVNNLNLRRAMSIPLGVTRPFDFVTPNGIPELISNAGGATVLVEVVGLNGVVPESGTGLFHYNTGAGWQVIPLDAIDEGGNVHNAVFPAFECGTRIDYFFSAESDEGIRFPDPAYPPPLHRSTAASTATVLASLDFEDAVGWTVDNVTLTDGAWERGVPAGNGSQGDPPADFDGSGQCWLTANRPGESDVDGGPTRLRSPNYNLAGTSNAFVSFARWFTNDDQDADRLAVQISSNGGVAFSTILGIEHTAGWTESRFKVSDFITPTTNVRVRFNVTDNPNNSLTEGAIDAFSIVDYECSAASCTKGDVNDDDAVNGADIALFTQTLVSGGTPGSVEFCAVDFDNDGALESSDDVDAFVTCLLDGVCP